LAKVPNERIDERVTCNQLVDGRNFPMRGQLFGRRLSEQKDGRCRC